MNIGVLFYIVLSIPFFILGILFAILKEKGTKFIAGFNSLTKDEQESYNERILAIKIV